ncbi:pleckstrin homology domain-containing family A member 2 [Pelobates cultripes]|uniref:Pleckstrin homology domain-containing family A member 2 n=1 Tax=Pelobates cultripes TaxID=61616 RepID=A0AAD1VVQ9_PELCU|nr:pleckstrin homology domain-containing family A member 2 [Pelobates cultripes]CAH2275194.1 pleckstrin homology domain-containing family A member 2 [Pelobates cultripes]
MPYVDRQNRTCGFLDIEDGENGRFLRRYFILDTKANYLLWYMDNPQNLPSGTGAVGSLKLTYISKVGSATVKQKPKVPFCFVINALSQRHFLQASDQKDLQEWVDALNSASKITVPRPGSGPATETGSTTVEDKKSQTAYKTEIIAGVVVQTPIITQNGGEPQDTSHCETHTHAALRRTQSQIPLPVNKSLPTRSILKSGFCVKQGNMRKNWKRRYFILDAVSISYCKCEKDQVPLRIIYLREILKTHECLVKSGDLLMRDNLFEIITGPRTFYIQADSPQEMHSWIKAINAAIQTLRMRYRVCMISV